MARCSQCGGDVAKTDVSCRHCGQEFPPRPILDRDAGLAYSRLADAALIVGQIVAGIAFTIAVVACVLALLVGEWWVAFVRGPIAALLVLANFVVFARVRDAR